MCDKIIPEMEQKERLLAGLSIIIILLFVGCTSKPDETIVLNTSSGCENYITFADMTKMIEEGRRIIVVESRVYDITSSRMNYTPGTAILLKDLNGSEKAALVDFKGTLCPNEMETVSHVLRIGFSTGTKGFASMLVNKTVEALKEQQKRVGNTDDAHHGWAIVTNTTLIRVDGVCRKDVDIIVTDNAPDPSELAGCSRKAFVGSDGNESIYIIQGEGSSEFLDLFIVTLMQEPCCQLISRYA
jgi:hypothetical protein